MRRGDKHKVMSSPVDFDSRDHEWLRVDQAVHFEIKELAECAARHGGRRQHGLVGFQLRSVSLCWVTTSTRERPLPNGTRVR